MFAHILPQDAWPLDKFKCDFKTVEAASNYMPMETVNVVIVHGPTCVDGLAAAAIACMAMTDIRVIPMEAGGDVPEVPEDASVLMVDVSPRDVEALLELKSRCGDLAILDHHESCRQQLSNYKGVFVTEYLSGATAMAAYRQFCDPGAITNVNYHAILKVVEARDTFNWDDFKDESFKHRARRVAVVINALVTTNDYQDTEAFTHPGIPFQKWHGHVALMRLLLLDRGMLTCIEADPIGILEPYDLKVAELIDSASSSNILLPNKTVIPVTLVRPSENGTHTDQKVCISDAGLALAEKFKKPVAFVTQSEATLWVSVRSIASAESALFIAMQFGGGGHRNAAGFNLPCSENPFLDHDQINSDR